MIPLAHIAAYIGLVIGLAAILSLLVLIHQLEDTGHDIDEDRK